MPYRIRYQQDRTKELVFTAETFYDYELAKSEKRRLTFLHPRTVYDIVMV